MHYGPHTATRRALDGTYCSIGRESVHASCYRGLAKAFFRSWAACESCTIGCSGRIVPGFKLYKDFISPSAVTKLVVPKCFTFSDVPCTAVISSLWQACSNCVPWIFESGRRSTTNVVSPFEVSTAADAGITGCRTVLSFRPKVPLCISAVHGVERMKRAAGLLSTRADQHSLTITGDYMVINTKNHITHHQSTSRRCQVGIQLNDSIRCILKCHAKTPRGHYNLKEGFRHPNETRAVDEESIPM